MKLTWDDLLRPLPDSNAAAKALASWSWCIPVARVHPLAISSFGDWFLESEAGPVYALGMLDGAFEQVASNAAEFGTFMNHPDWQETFLLSLLVFTLKEQGQTLAPDECFGFQIHPVLGGSPTSDNVVVMNLIVWNSICGQLHRQTASQHGA